MLKYMLRRVLQMIPVLFIITIITFLFVNASGDPTAMLLPPEATASDREVLREALGLNEPLYVQYGIFIKNALHGDFGTSFRYGTSAMGVVMEKMPAFHCCALFWWPFRWAFSAPIRRIRPLTWWSAAFLLWGAPCPASGWALCSSCCSA